MLRFFRWVLLFLALAGLVVTILPSAYGGDTWWVRYLDFPRLEFLVAMLLIWLGLALVARRWLSGIVLLALTGAIAYDVAILFPYTTIAGTQEMAAESCPDGNRLRLLEVNVKMTNRHDDTLLNMVRQVRPDVAWFQETDAWWAKELSGLAQDMPYHQADIQPNYFGVDLYSRLPLVDPRVEHLTGSANPAVFTGVRLPGGQTVMFYGIHPRPPQKGQSTAERDGQLMVTALTARGDRVPHIVAGDMNSVPWEDVIRRTERVGRFLDPRIGCGLYITWSAENPVTKWPLDQILPGPGFTLLHLQVLPAFGSDHHPYLAELCLDLAAASRQPPPALQPDDIAAAQAAVRKGQGEADKEGYEGRYGPEGTRTSQ